MLRRNWGFIAAVAAFLIAAAAIWTYLKPAYPLVATSEYQKAEDTSYSPGNPRCYPSRLASLPEREAMDERYRCENAAEEHRLKNDDLVQQTRSADAAIEMLGQIYRQSLMMLAGTIFGLLTLIAAFAAVLYAKRAADATESGVAHSKDVTATQLRPYVYIGDTTIDRPVTRKSKVRIQVKNYGLSPAVSVEVGTASRLVNRPILDQARDLQIENWEPLTPLAPQGENTVRLGIYDLGQEGFDLIRSGKAAVVALHGIRYTNLDGTISDEMEMLVYIDSHTFADGSVCLLNEWARFHSHQEPEPNSELQLDGADPGQQRS